MKEIMSNEQTTKTLKRMTHEIIERSNDLSLVVLVGIMKKGLPIAKILQENLAKFADVEVPVYGIDIEEYRDDIAYQGNRKNAPIDITNKTVILVDDVLYTGRSARAAMDALMDLGRPNHIQLAVLVDRGHRELPIRADYVGKNIPTSKQEKVVVDLTQMNVSII